MDKRMSKSAATWASIGVLALAVIVIGYMVYHAQTTNKNGSASGSNSHSSASANGSLYLSPAKTSVSAGGQLTVQVRENSSSSPVNGVEADFSYPADKLDFVSFDDTGTAYGIKAQEAANNGTVKIARGNTSPLTGDQAVATVNFKAKPGAGSAALTFLSSSAVVSSTTNTNILGSTTGGTYQVK